MTAVVVAEEPGMPGSKMKLLIGPIALMYVQEQLMPCHQQSPLEGLNKVY